MTEQGPIIPPELVQGPVNQRADRQEGNPVAVEAGRDDGQPGSMVVVEAGAVVDNAASAAGSDRRPGITRRWGEALGRIAGAFGERLGRAMEPLRVRLNELGPRINQEIEVLRQRRQELGIRGAVGSWVQERVSDIRSFFADREERLGMEKREAKMAEMGQREKDSREQLDGGKISQERYQRIAHNCEQVRIRVRAEIAVLQERARNMRENIRIRRRQIAENMELARQWRQQHQEAVS